MLWRICINAALDRSLDREIARERNRAAVLDELNHKFGAKGSGFA